jgi:hypothetical protein
MIATLEMLSMHHAVMEGDLSMGAPVLESIDLRAFGPDQHDRLAGKRYAQRFPLFQVF